MKPKLKLKTDKEDYFEGDIINGQVKLGIKRDFGEFFLQIKLIKEESYVLFNKGGDQALASKEDS